MEASADRREGRMAVFIGGLLVVALAAGLGALLLHHACFHPGPPVDRPEVGTPRGSYCSTAEATDPWLSMTVGPIAVYVGVAVLLRGRRLLWTGIAALAIAGGALAVGTIAEQLEFATTI